MTLDEQIVAMIAVEDGCMKAGSEQLPAGCPDSIQAMYAIAQWHPVTILIAAVFVWMMVYLTMSALSRGDGH
jgi:hypothetical protein